MSDLADLEKALRGTGDALADDERRSEPRYLSEGNAEVTLLDCMQSSPLPARMEEVSRSGLRLWLERRLVAGSRVRIRFGDTVAFAEVRWCQDDRRGGFSTGLKIEHSVPYGFISRGRDAAS